MIDESKADKNAPVPAKPAQPPQPPFKEGQDKGPSLSTRPIPDPPASRSDAAKDPTPGGQASAQPSQAPGTRR